MWIDKKDEEQQSDQSQDQSNLQNPSVGAGAGSVPVQSSQTAATGNMSSTSPDPVAPGQKFGTIQDYFKGNKSQGEQLGEQFTSKLDTAKQQSQQQIGEAANAAKGQVAANTIGFDQNLINQTVADPTKVAGDEAAYANFMKQWDASYKGPQSFEATDEYTKAAKAAQEAKSKADLASSAGGRQQMLQDEFKVYGAGNKGLDEALIQQSNQFGKVGEKAKELSSLQDYLGAKSQEVGTEAKKAKETTEATKAKTQEALLGEKGAVKQFKQDIDTRTAQERTKAEQSQKALAEAFKNRAALTDDQLKTLGITRQDYDNLIAKEKTAGYTNLQDYLTFQNPNAQISRESVASQADRERDAALAKLTSGSKFLGATRENGKLVDFDKDTALQTYLDKIGADEAERERARLEREQQQREEEEARNAEKTAKRESTQNIIGDSLLGGTIIPGAGLLTGGALTDKIGDIIDKDKVANKIQDYIGNQSQKLIDTGKDIVSKPLENIDKLVAPTIVAPAKEAIKAVDKNVTQPVVNTVKSVVNSVKSVFCFDGDTLVDMQDGSKKPIKDIQLGERVMGGGVVVSTRQSFTANGTRFKYKGITVTGSHAVKEKRWLRVKDSVHAERINGGGVVYSLVTDLHRIYINGIQFADEHETDKYEYLSMDESLAELNKIHLAVY